jgi:hypothetical protein
MSPAKWTACGCAIAATLTVGFGYALDGQIYTAFAFALLGAFWCEALLRNWRWPTPLLLLLFISGGVYGAASGFSPFIMLTGIVAALATWDLDGLLQRFSQVKPQARQPGLERRHLQRLAVVAGAGLLLGSAALVIRVQLSFILAAGLVLVVIVGASQVVRYLRRSSS